MPERVHAGPPSFSLGAWTVDLDGQALLGLDGAEQALTALETKLLGYLCAHADRTVPHRELLTEVWGYAPTVESAAVKKTVHRLRRKLGPEGQRLVAVARVGYRLVIEAARAPSPTLPRTSFVGRHSELASCQRMLAQSRLVTIVGHAGVGKTRLLQELARALPATAFVDLAAAEDVHELRRCVVHTLGGGPRPIDAIRARPRPVLLLDNVEHLVSAAESTVGRWLDDAPQLIVVVTSRERLRLRGEAVLRLGPLELDEGERLFRERARAAGGVVPATADVRALVAHLDGLPLAIEMAASTTATLSVELLLERLALEHLGHDRSDRSPRHRTFLQAIQLSWDLLAECERDALARLACFRHGFGVEGALQVGQVGLSDLVQLTDKSLLRCLAPDRWALYEGLRQLAARHTPRAVHAEHARFVAAQARAHLDEADVAPCHAADLRAALPHAAPDDAVWIITELLRDVQRTGRTETVTGFGSLLQGLQPISEAARLERSRCLATVAHLSRRDPEAALQQAWELAPTSADRLRVVRSAVVIHTARGSLHTARRWLARTDRDGVPSGLDLWLTFRERRYDDALALLQRPDSTDGSVSSANRRLILVGALCRVGEFARAQAIAEEVLTRAREQPMLQLQACRALALVLLQRRRFPQARELLEQLRRDPPIREERAYVDEALLALVHLLQDAPTEARDVLTIDGFDHSIPDRGQDLWAWARGLAFLLVEGNAEAADLAFHQAHLQGGILLNGDWRPVGLLVRGQIDGARRLLDAAPPWPDEGIGDLHRRWLERAGGGAPPPLEPRPAEGELLERQMCRLLDTRWPWDRSGTAGAVNTEQNPPS